jgi:hypothetical protein
MDKIRYFPLWLIVLSKLMSAPLRQPDPAKYISGLDELRSALQVPHPSDSWLREKIFTWLIAKIYGMQEKVTVKEEWNFWVNKADDSKSDPKSEVVVLVKKNGEWTRKGTAKTVNEALELAGDDPDFTLRFQFVPQEETHARLPYGTFDPEVVSKVVAERIKGEPHVR